jgi:branched-chain amino acid transport system permease protein
LGKKKNERNVLEYIVSLLILTGINAILATSFNLILGYGGLLSIAHPIFYAIGGYASALISIHFSVPVPIAILLGGIIAATLSFGVSLPSLRVSGDYLVIASLGFQLGILHIINNIEFTGAASGLSDIPLLIEGTDRSIVSLLIVIVVLIMSILIIKWIVKGPFGRAITAMRNDETAFSAVGRNPIQIKVFLMALGSGIAGIAGGLYGHYFLYLTPEQFGIFTSAAFLTMVVIGGAGTVWGPAIGALLLTLFPEAITFLNLPVSVMAPLQGVIFTALVLIFIFFRPQGMIGSHRGIDGLEVWSQKINTSRKPLKK